MERVWVFERQESSAAAFKRMRTRSFFNDQAGVRISGDGNTIITAISRHGYYQFYQWGISAFENEKLEASWTKVGFTAELKMKSKYKMMDKRTTSLSHDGNCFVIHENGGRNNKSSVFDSKSNATTIDSGPILSWNCAGTRRIYEACAYHYSGRLTPHGWVFQLSWLVSCQHRPVAKYYLPEVWVGPARSTTAARLLRLSDTTTSVPMVLMLLIKAMQAQVTNKRSKQKPV